jgi:DNA-directed RNA polymerase subunit RPC12/RpoP
MAWGFDYGEDWDDEITRMYICDHCGDGFLPEDHPKLHAGSECPHCKIGHLKKPEATKD